MNIKIEKTTNPKEKPLKQESEGTLGFGNYFTDHMFLMEYKEDQGWINPRIVPYQPITLDPASVVLHYGQEIFEGMKSYRGVNDDILLFRAYENAKRFNRSAERMCMPQLDEDMYYEALRTLVDLDRDWVPHAEGTSMALRIALIATDAKLNVHPSSNYLLFMFCSPSGSYYKEGLNPISIYVEDKYVRSAEGGTGFAKTGGNYAGSLKASYEAVQKGYAQVLWLDGIERKYVEEVGAMNIMFVIDDVIVTAPLSGTILAGVTRSSIITLAKEMGLKVEERRLTIDEIFKASEQGQLNEVFGTGTAAVVSPVGKITYKNREIIINNNETGSITKKLYNKLISIQTGKEEDKFGWVSVV